LEKTIKIDFSPKLIKIWLLY